MTRGEVTLTPALSLKGEGVPTQAGLFGGSQGQDTTDFLEEYQVNSCQASVR